MVWGTDFTTSVFIARTHLENQYQIQDAIDECEKEIERATQYLAMLCSSTPKDIVSDEFKDDVVIWLQNQIEEQISSIREGAITSYQLTLYKESLDESQSPIDLHTTGLHLDQVNEVISPDPFKLVGDEKEELI